MRKQWQYFKTSFIQSLQFRGEVLVWILLGIVPTIVFLIAWKSIFTGQTVINGFTYGAMVHYYVIISLLGGLSGVYFESHRSAQIREGNVDHLLIKPLSFPRIIALSDLGNKMIYVLFSLPVFLLMVLVLLKLGIVFPDFTLTPSSLAAFIILIIFAYLMEFILGLLVVLATFWFEAAEGLQHFKWFFLSLFSGKMIPIIFMPTWLQKMISLLPFRYSYALPAELLQGKATLTAPDLLYMTGTILALGLLSRFVWQKAMLRYSSAGG